MAWHWPLALEFAGEHSGIGQAIACNGAVMVSRIANRQATLYARLMPLPRPLVECVVISYLLTRIAKIAHHAT